MPRKSASRGPRLAAWALFHALSVVVGVITVRPGRRASLTPSPPLTMGIAAWLLGVWHRAPFIYSVQELYPDIAISLGAGHATGRLIRLLFALERFVYARAARVTLIAEAHARRAARAKGVPAEKVTLVSQLRRHVRVLRAAPAQRVHAASPQLDDRFVVCYAGNLGPAQGLETLLDAAAELRAATARAHRPRRRRHVWQHLGRRAFATERLDNVRLVPHQPLARCRRSTARRTCRSSRRSATTGVDAVPSKVYRIMACGGAVLAMTDAELRSRARSC